MLEGVFNENEKETSGFPQNGVLSGGTVPPTNMLFGGTVPQNIFLLYIFLKFLTVISKQGNEDIICRTKPPPFVLLEFPW